MNLVIHDLSPRRWARISQNYSGWNVVTDNGAMHPCIGCFSCWNRTPGKCAIKDGYENMGSLIHQADEVVVISRYTYGGFSGSVKNVFDRCLGYVLPQFEVTGEETHHKKRYDEDKPFSFIFYGPEFTDSEKAAARRYVRAVCDNIRGYVKRVEFRVSADDNERRGAQESAQNCEPDSAGFASVTGKTMILNGSMRNVTGNSAKLSRKLAGQLSGDTEIIDLRNYIHNLPGLAEILNPARRIILCVPLYVDGLPSQVIRLMEIMESRAKSAADPAVPKQIYVLANMGLYESSQLVNLFSAVKQWCTKCGFDYCGGLGISAGELLGTLMEVIPFRHGATRKAAQGMERLAEAINAGSKIEDIYAEPFGFPRSLYNWIANSNWNRTAIKNGIKPKDLYRTEMEE